jgi:hypothetical protein
LQKAENQETKASIKIITEIPHYREAVVSVRLEYMEALGYLISQSSDAGRI